MANDKRKCRNKHGDTPSCQPIKSRAMDNGRNGIVDGSRIRPTPSCLNDTVMGGYKAAYVLHQPPAFGDLVLTHATKARKVYGRKGGKFYSGHDDDYASFCRDVKSGKIR